MKKLFALLTVSALIIVLAACGDSGKNDATEPAADETAEQTVQTDAETAETTAEPDDDATVEDLKEKLTGEWGFPANDTEDIENLTFNADGTGQYKGIDKSYSFTYVIHIDHREYNNGDPYDESMLTMTYDNGETEDIIFFFTEDGKLAFHNADNGGYSGVMDFIDALIKE